MPLLTTGEFYTVTVASPTSAAWQALPSPRPGYNSGELSDAISDGTNLPIYVTDSGSGSFSFIGGAGFGFDDTIVTVVAGPLTKYTMTADDGSTTTWADGGSTLLYYDATANVLREVSGAALGGFQAFIAAL